MFQTTEAQLKIQFFLRFDYISYTIIVLISKLTQNYSLPTKVYPEHRDWAKKEEPTRG